MERHWDLSRLLHALLHGTESLVYSNHPRKAAASTCLVIIFGRIARGVPWFLLSTSVLMQLPYQWTHCQCSVTAVHALVLSMVALKPKCPAVWACLGVDPLDMPRTPYRASKGKHSQYPTMPYNPHPHIIICTLFVSSIDYNVFMVLQYHLKDLLCRKVT